MALSGSVNTTAYNSRYLTFAWTATQDAVNNTSTISWTLKGGGGSSTTYKLTNRGVAIDGAYVYTATASMNLGNGTSVASGSKTLNHNSDRTRSFTVAIEAMLGGKAITASTTFTLNTVPGASAITMGASSVEINDPVSISFSGGASNFTHNLTYAVNGQTGTIVNNHGSTAYIWTVPLNIANAINNATSATCTITCKSYQNGGLVGSKSATITLTVPNKSPFSPSITNLALSELNAKVTQYFGAKWVKGLSKLKGIITANAEYSATINSYSISFNGTTYSGSTFETDELKTSGSNTITVKATDSRGYTATYTRTITVENYTKPFITSLTATRVNDAETPDDEGLLGKIDMVAGVYALQGNTATYKLEYRENGSETYIDTQFSSSAISISTYRLVSNLSIDKSYEFRLTVTDPFYSTVATVILSSGFTLMDFGADGHKMAIGKVAEYDGLEIALPIKMDDQPIFFENATHTAELVQYPSGRMAILVKTKATGASHYWLFDPSGYEYVDGVKQQYTVGDTMNIGQQVVSGMRLSANQLYVTIKLDKPVASAVTGAVFETTTFQEFNNARKVIDGATPTYSTSYNYLKNGGFITFIFTNAPGTGYAVNAPVSVYFAWNSKLKFT